MNLDTIEKVWKEFSELKNGALKHKKRELGNTTQANYLVNYTDEIATFSFIGMLSTSTEIKNTDKTSIIVEFEHRLALQNFKLERDKPNSTISLDEKTTFEKDLLNQLQKFEGNSITLNDNFIRIDSEHIFSTIDAFNHVIALILTIKTAS